MFFRHLHGLAIPRYSHNLPWLTRECSSHENPCTPLNSVNWGDASQAAAVLWLKCHQPWTFQTFSRKLSFMPFVEAMPGLTTLLLQLVYQKCRRTLQDSAGWRGILPFESYVHTACVFRRCRSYRVYLNLFDKYFIEGSLEVKPPTIWTDGKAEVGRLREEKSRRCRCAKR